MNEFEFYSDWKIILPGKGTPNINLANMTRGQVMKHLTQEGIINYKMESRKIANMDTRMTIPSQSKPLTSVGKSRIF